MTLVFYKVRNFPWKSCLQALHHCSPLKFCPGPRVPWPRHPIWHLFFDTSQPVHRYCNNWHLIVFLSFIPIIWMHFCSFILSLVLVLKFSSAFQFCLILLLINNKQSHISLVSNYALSHMIYLPTAFPAEWNVLKAFTLLLHSPPTWNLNLELFCFLVLSLSILSKYKMP